MSLPQLFTSSCGLVSHVWAPRGQVHSCFGLCGVSPLVTLSWQPWEEDLVKGKRGVTPVPCCPRQLEDNAPCEWETWGWNETHGSAPGEGTAAPWRQLCTAGWWVLGNIVDAPSVSRPRGCRREIFVFRLLLALFFTVASDLSRSAD